MIDEKIVCLKCNKTMEIKKGKLKYLENIINYEFLTCPECKTIYIPEELVEGKMHEIEMAFEDK
ncbi:DVU_1557 family redox protein [Acetobacterium carbinolicum]|uniref:DVU_1557 family redox protein n=1 Tax=Acetobacterium carbinolicum TaxID=52690 RepID=UPI0039BFE447